MIVAVDLIEDRSQQILVGIFFRITTSHNQTEGQFVGHSIKSVFLIELI